MFSPSNMNTNAFQPTNFKCYRCGEEGHTARSCTNPAASWSDRQRIKEEEQQRNRPQVPVQATGANTKSLGQGPVGVAAHQAEAVDDMDSSIETTQDEWNLGDEDTEFKAVYACEKCGEEDDEWTAEDEICVAAKRTSVEIESDEEVQSPRPKKTRKAGPKDGWSNGRLDMPEGTTHQDNTNRQSTPQSDSTLQDETSNPKNKMSPRVQPLPPSLKKPTAATRSPRRGTPPVLKPRGMGQQESWSASEWIQNAKVEISVAQLMQIAPKARSSVVEAIRLKPNPNRKAAQKKRVRIDEGSQAEEATIHEVHEVSLQSEGKLRMRNEKPDINNLNSAYNQRHGKGNFYTSALIKPRKKQTTGYEVKRILIDPRATLNLIPVRMVEKMACIIYEDKSMVIRVANGAYQRLLGVARFMIEVAGVKRIIEAFVVLGNTSYSLILGRPWLRSVKAVGLYENDEY